VSEKKTIKWFGIDLPLEETLDYDTFCKKGEKFGIPLFNNFFAYFRSGEWGDGYRLNPAFQKLKQEHPELVERVTDVVDKHWPDVDKVSPALYEAYKIMISYTINGKKVLNYPDLFA
jgi:hypothetical protein